MKTKLFAAALMSVAFAVPPAMADDVVVVPDTVTTYVTEQPMDETVTVDTDITTGSILPDKVVIKNVPDNDGFGFAVVNKKRVIVEPSTRKVVKIVE
jgi:hypothetical protein